MAKKLRPYLPALSRALKEIGDNLRLARLRRRLSATVLADRAGITRVTLKKVESGDPGTSLGSYASVLHSLGLTSDLLLIARDDVLGRKLQDAGLDTPQRAPRKSAETRSGLK